MVEIKGEIFIQGFYRVYQNNFVIQQNEGSCKLVGLENGLTVFKFLVCEQINGFVESLCAGIVSTGTF